MLNYFNFKPFGDRYLLTNDFGAYAFVTKEDVADLLRGRLDPDSDLSTELERKRFVFRGSANAFTRQAADAMRDSKNYVLSPTSLHIFVVTSACNLNCVYCQAHEDASPLNGYMDRRTAERAVDMALSSPATALSMEFQGGEPLLNFPVIRHAVEHALAHAAGRSIRISVVTNLTLLTDEMLDFFREHGVSLSTSLDGPAFLHDRARPYRSGGPTFQDVRRAIARVRAAGVPIGAIQTTTRASLPHAREIVDTYAELGFGSVFLRPLTPLGCAREQWDRVGYEASEFVSFYRDAIGHLLALNRRGTSIQEGHASMLLSKILHGYPVNYMELRSPCGASVGQLAYYMNGDVFTCDEGRMLFEMGNDAFRLGNVETDSYQDLMESPVCRATCAASVTESAPGCCDCVYQPYCGLCPVISLAQCGDLLPKTPNGYRCGVYSGMLDTLFGLLKENDPDTMRILKGWRA